MSQGTGLALQLAGKHKVSRQQGSWEPRTEEPSLVFPSCCCYWIFTPSPSTPGNSYQQKEMSQDFLVPEAKIVLSKRERKRQQESLPAASQGPAALLLPSLWHRESLRKA